MKRAHILKPRYEKVASSDQIRKEANIQVYTGKKFMINEPTFKELIYR